MKITKVIIPACALLMSVHAQETWDGSTDTNWSGASDATSWSGGTYTDATGAIFDGTNGLGAVNITGIVRPDSIDNSTNAAGYTFEIESGGKLQLVNSAVINSDVIVNANNGSGTIQTFGGTSTFNGDLTLNANNLDMRGSNYIFNGGVSGEGGFGINGSNYIFNGVVDLDANNDGAGGNLGFTSAGNNAANASVLTQSGNDYGSMSMNFGGYLRTDAVDALASDAVINWGWSRHSWSSATLDLNGNDQTVGGLNIFSISDGLGGDQSITSSTAATLTLDNATGTEYQGRFIGALSVVKNGDGTQVLNNLSSTTAPATDTAPSPGPIVVNSNTGTTTINAGRLEIGDGGTSGDLSTSSAIIINGGTLGINQSDTVTQGTDFSASAITGAGNLEQMGAGTTELTAVNTYTGVTTVTAGTLSLTGSGSIDASTEIAIASGAVFSVAATSDKTFGGSVTGEGSVAGAFTASGASAAIRPGTGGDAGIGTLTFSDSLVVASGATLSLELAAALGTANPVSGQTHPDLSTVSTALDGGTSHDSIEGGILDFTGADAGSINISFEGYTAAEGDYFDLFDFTSATGLTASLLDLPTLSGDLYWDTSLLASEGMIVIVPEPTSTALLGLGALGLLVRRKRA